jgi:hypothetical protein
MTRLFHRLIPLLRSFSENFSNTFFLALFAGMIFFTSGCEENPSKIGSKLLPASDFVSIKSTDTIKVRSFTMYTNSVETDNPSVSYIGTLYDPYFGNTTAGLVSQLRLGSAWDDKYFEIDSVRLYLRFLNVSGNTTEPHMIRLSEISERIYSDSAYYSDQTVPLTGWSVLCSLPDTLQADTINNVTINVPIEFGSYLTRDTSMFEYIKKDFRSYFKGLYFQMEPSANPLFVSLSVDYQSSDGGYSNYFVLYMHDASGIAKTFAFVLDAISSNAAFNTFVHDFDAALPSKKIQHINDTTYLDTLSYAQTLNGTYIKLRIPGLEDIKNDPEMDNISINKARLIFPIQYDGNFYQPSTISSQVYMRYVTTTGYKAYVPDLSIVSSSFFDGTPDTTTNHVYNLNIPTFVQMYLDEDAKNYLKPELELFLSPSSSYNVILKANNSHTSVKFELTYTKF